MLDFDPLITLVCLKTPKFPIISPKMASEGKILVVLCAKTRQFSYKYLRNAR